VGKKKRLPQKLARERARLTLREQLTKPWRLAIFKLREQLAEETLNQTAARRRFQNGRLIENVIAELEPSAIKANSVVMWYWLFCGSPWQDQLGYNEARQQHYAELKALGLSPEFQPSESWLKRSPERILIELFFRLDSLASWIEAQESWIFWRSLNREPAVWRHNDSEARRQAMVANIIARMPEITNELSDWAIARIVEGFRTWSISQWEKILKAAARSAGRAQESLELETWVWWRYPIFSRYHWSTAEVCRAARKKLGQIHHVNYEAAFQSAWVRRGLRFTGKRTRRQRRPPLWDFVISEEVPKNVSLTYSLLT
jgi:hypothetical protein